MKRTREAGYSLVEVLIAIAITAIVLLTVVSLFYMGRRNVYSGKQMTYAVAVGTRMLEDLSSMTAQDLGNNFSITDTTALGNVTIQGTTYANAIGLDTTTCTGSPLTCTSDPSGFLAAWDGLIDQTKLSNAQAGLVIIPRNPTNTNAPWSTATFIKVRAWVQWDEAKNRRRIAFFDTTKVNRQ